MRGKIHFSGAVLTSNLWIRSGVIVMRVHDPKKVAERLKRLNQNQGKDTLEKSTKDFQKSSKRIQQPGPCRICGN